MNNAFEFVGKILPCKETDNFKPFNDVKFNSGWVRKSIRFNMVCGTNRHLLESASLYDSKNVDGMTIYTVGKAEIKDGVRGKGEKLQISFKTRTNPDVIEKVADFKKFVVDMELPNRRFLLEKAVNKFKDGTMTDEQMNKLKVHSIEECEQALADSKKKRHEFISEYDFVDYLNKFVNSEKIKDMTFKAIGDYTLEYNESKDIWYRKFTVTKIYRTDEESKSNLVLGFTFGRNAVDDESFDTTKKIKINGYLSTYMSNYKKSFFCPISLTLDGNGDEKAEKKTLAFKKKFIIPNDNEHDYREIGLVCTVLDGAQRVEVTEDMLTDEQRESLEFGLITMDDIRKELGKDVYGERVTDIVIESLARGYSGGAADTAYEDKDFGKPRISRDIPANDEDIFADDDI